MQHLRGSDSNSTGLDQDGYGMGNRNKKITEVSLEKKKAFKGA